MAENASPLRVALWGRPRIARWLTVAWAVSCFVVASAADVRMGWIFPLLSAVPVLLVWWLQLIILGWRGDTEESHKPHAWIAWAALPALSLLVVVAAELGASRFARFKLSERSLETHARSVLDGTAVVPGAVVGLYRVLEARVLHGRVYFVTSNRGGRVSGVVFSPSGRPLADDRLIEEPAHDLRCAPATEGWWYFEQRPKYV